MSHPDTPQTPAPAPSAADVLELALSNFEQHPSGHWTFTGDAGEVVAHLRALAAHPTPPAGAGAGAGEARHIKSGKVYAVVGRAKHKALGERWIDTILYRNDAGELFSRELADFEQSFEPLAQAQAEGGSR